MPRRMNAIRALQILGLGLDATPEEIKRAYREQVKVWHPDLVRNDPGLKATAEETLKNVNEAYETLESEGALSGGNAQGEKGQGLPPLSLAYLRTFVSEGRLPAAVRGMDVLSAAGLFEQDIADVICSSCRVLDCLLEEHYEEATQLSVAYVTERLEELRDSGIPEGSLLVLSDSGLAVGEIAHDVRNIIGLREELVTCDTEYVKLIAAGRYEFWSQARPGWRHRNRSSQKNQAQASLFERYAHILAAAHRLRPNAAEAETSVPAGSSIQPTWAISFSEQFVLLLAVMGLVSLAAKPSVFIEHPFFFMVLLALTVIIATKRR